MARKSEARQGQAVVQEEVMTMQPGFADSMPPARPGRDAGRVLRVLALIAVAIGLAAITAAACLLSYSSIHYLATVAGVSPRLARLYPLIFDALLVLAGCSVLALRGAGLISRVYSWLCLLVLLAALAGGGAVRAAGIKVPHRLAGILAAVIPWALVLIGFGLLLALLRYARIRRLGQQPAEAEREAGQDGEPADLVMISSTTAPPDRAAGPAAIVPGFTGTPGAPGPTGRPAVTRTGGSPEAPTAPQAPVPAAPVPAAPVQAAPVQAAPVQAAPADGAPVPAAQPAHAAVRQADLQLKARVPRQPAGQQAPASPAEARPGPFMPPVGPRPAPEEPAGAGAADAAAGAAATRTGELAGAGDPRPGQAASPGAPIGASGSAQQTNPRPIAEPPASTATTAESPPPENAAATSPPDEATANEPDASTVPPGQASAGPAPADAPVTATSLNAAPVNDDEETEPGAPPALNRPHSSPTPPED